MHLIITLLELIGLGQAEYEHNDNPDQHSNDFVDNTEFRFINRDHMAFKDSVNHYDDEHDTSRDKGFIRYENELNDIKELEQELKRNLASSNSNFMNPTFEEPSPSKPVDLGAYHSNVVSFSSNQQQLVQMHDRTQALNNNGVQLRTSSNSANMARDYFIRKDTAVSSIPNNCKFMLNDQISMFSSQDAKAEAVHKMNTSDIVEYSQDHSAFKQQNMRNYDTLERHVEHVASETQRDQAKREYQLQNFHSFNPDIPNDEETNVDTSFKHNYPISEEAFSFDRK